MSLAPQDPGNVGRNLALEIDHGRGEGVERLATGWADVGLADVEQHRGLEYEPIAHHPDIRPGAQDLPQAAEKVRAIAIELLNLLRQRDVEPLAEVGDLRLRFLVRRLRCGERILDRRELLAQRRDLLVEHVDLGQSLRRYLLLLIERDGRRRGLAACRVGVDHAPRRGILELLLLPLGGVERGGEGGYLAFVDALLGALER